MISLSSTENETASPCVPSRSVVSNVWMRIYFLYVFNEVHGTQECVRYLTAAASCSCGTPSSFFFLLRNVIICAEFFAHALDWLIVAGLPHREELVTAGLVFVDPFAWRTGRIESPTGSSSSLCASRR